MGTPWCLLHGILGNVAKHYGIWVPPPVSAPWHSGKCCKALWDMGTPPCGQTEGQTRVNTLPSRRTTYAGGSNKLELQTKNELSALFVDVLNNEHQGFYLTGLTKLSQY